ncbi:hypothetical protein [Streptomyces sp. NPDC001635]
MSSLKGVNSRYLHAEYTGQINRIGLDSVFGSRSYFAGPCGGAPLTGTGWAARELATGWFERR